MTDAVDDRAQKIVSSAMREASDPHRTPDVTAKWSRWLRTVAMLLAAAAFLVAEVALVVRIAQLDDRLVTARIEAAADQRQQTELIVALEDQVRDLSGQLDAQEVQIGRLESQVRSLGEDPVAGPGDN